MKKGEFTEPARDKLREDGYTDEDIERLEAVINLTIELEPYADEHGNPIPEKLDAHFWVTVGKLAKIVMFNPPPIHGSD